MTFDRVDVVVVACILCVWALLASLGDAESATPTSAPQGARMVSTGQLAGAAITGTVTLSATMPDSTYHVNVMSVSDGEVPSWQVGGLTATTFRVTASANSGTLNFTYETVDY